MARQIADALEAAHECGIDPSWFPDGSRMVLSSSRTGQRNIWTASAGSRAAPITTGSAIDERPVVSPDGTQIAFVSDRGGHRGIWTVSASGGEIDLPMGLVVRPAATINTARLAPRAVS